MAQEEYISALVEVGLDATALQEGLGQLGDGSAAIQEAGLAILRQIEALDRDITAAAGRLGAGAGAALGSGIAQGAIRALQSELPQLQRIVDQVTASLTNNKPELTRGTPFYNTPQGGQIYREGPGRFIASDDQTYKRLADASAASHALFLQTQQRQIDQARSRLQAANALPTPLALPSGSGSSVPVDFTAQSRLQRQRAALERAGQLQNVRYGTGDYITGLDRGPTVIASQSGPRPPRGAERALQRDTRAEVWHQNDRYLERAFEGGGQVGDLYRTGRSAGSIDAKLRYGNPVFTSELSALTPEALGVLFGGEDATRRPVRSQRPQGGLINLQQALAEARAQQFGEYAGQAFDQVPVGGFAGTRPYSTPNPGVLVQQQRDAARRAYMLRNRRGLALEAARPDGALVPYEAAFNSAFNLTGGLDDNVRLGAGGAGGGRRPPGYNPFPFADEPAPEPQKPRSLFERIQDTTASAGRGIAAAGRGVPNQLNEIPGLAVPENNRDLQSLVQLRGMVKGLASIAEQAAAFGRGSEEVNNALRSDAQRLRQLAAQLKGHEQNVRALGAGTGEDPGLHINDFERAIAEERGPDPFRTGYRIPNSRFSGQTPRQSHDENLQGLYDQTGGDPDEALRILREQDEQAARDAQAERERVQQERARQREQQRQARYNARSGAGGGSGGSGGSGGVGGGFSDPPPPPPPPFGGMGGPADSGSGSGKWQGSGPNPAWRGWEQHNATTGLRSQFLSGQQPWKENHPLDALFGGIDNIAQYVKYFAALSGSILIFDALTRSISESVKQALQFQLATTDLAAALDTSDSAANRAAQGYGNAAAAAGQSPTTGVQTATVGAQRFGAAGASPVEQQALHAAVLDPSAKATDYAQTISSVAQEYGVGLKDLGTITNDAYIAFHHFGVGINDTLQGVEAIAPVAKAAGAPLNDLIQTIGLVSARTGKSGTAVAQALRPILESAGNPTMIKALADAGINPTGSSWGNLQALAGRFQTLNQPTQSQILREVGGRSGILGSYLSNGGDVAKAVTDAVDHPNAANDQFKKRMDDVLNVAKQLGSELLNLGKDVVDSGALSVLGLVLKGLTPIVTVLDHIVQVFDDLPGHMGQWIVGLGTAYGLMKLIATSSVGARIAGTVGAATAPGVGAVAGGLYRGAAGGLFAGGLLGQYRTARGLLRDGQAAYDNAGIPPGTVVPYGSPLGAAGPLGERPTWRNLNIRGALPRLGINAAIGVAGIASAAGTTDPLQSGLSAGLGAAALLGPAAGIGVGLFVAGLREVQQSSREAALALKDFNSVEQDIGTYLKGQHTAADTQQKISDLTKAADEAHGVAHPDFLHQLGNATYGAIHGDLRGQGQEAVEKSASERERTLRSQIKQLQDALNAQKNATDALQTSGTANASAIFGGFQLSDAAQTGVQALGQLGLSGGGQAQALLQALSQKGVAQNLLPSSIGDISTQLSTLAQGVSTSVQATTGSSAAGAQQSLAFAQQVLGRLRQSKNASPQDLQQAQELVDQLTQAASAAINQRTQAIGSLINSFRAQDDVFGRDATTISGLQQSLLKDKPGSDQAIQDQQPLNAAYLQQVQDRAAATTAQFQAGVDPRNQSQVAASQLVIAQRNLQNSTRGSTAFFQAQSALQQAQATYSTTVAEAQATLVTSGGNPADQADILNRQIQANNIRIAALRKPLPKLPDASKSTGLGLGLGTATDPLSSGVDSGLQFVQGIKSTDYKAVGNQVASDLVSGLLGDNSSTTGSGASLPDLLGTSGSPLIGGAGLLAAPGSKATGLGALTSPVGLGNDTGAAGAAAANAQAGAALGYTPEQAVAIEQGRQAAAAQLTYQNAQAAYQQRQLAEQAQEARFSLQASQSGGGAYATALAQVAGGQSQAAFLQREEPNNYQNDPAYINALQQVAQGVIALRQAIVDNTKNVALLSGDITDPRFTAAADANAAAQKLALDQAAGASPEVLNADTVAARQARAQSQETNFQTGLSLAGQQYQLGRDARFASDAGAMSFSAYMNYLNTTRQHLLAVKNMTYQQQQDLIAVDQAIQSATSTMQGQFNLGTIKVPSIYEVRRSAATDTSGGSGYSDNRTIAITINGANKAEVVQVLREQLGTVATQVRPTTPAKVRR